MNEHNNLPVPFVFVTPPQQNVPQPQREIEVPARVRVALVFLDQMTHKARPLVASNDLSIEWRDGQDLTTGEKHAQSAACNLLADYFSGKLRLTNEEKKKVKKREKRDYPQDTAGVFIRCVACQSDPTRPIRENCALCHGTGELLVFSTTTGEDEDED